MLTHKTLRFEVGETWQLDFQCNDNQGNPLDLTGAALTWKLDDSDRLTNALTLTLGNGIAVLAPTTGVAYVTVTAVQSNALLSGLYWDELIVTLPNGTVSSQAGGLIEAMKGLT